MFVFIVHILSVTHTDTHVQTKARNRILLFFTRGCAVLIDVLRQCNSQDLRMQGNKVQLRVNMACLLISSTCCLKQLSAGEEEYVLRFDESLNLSGNGGSIE